MHEPDAPSQRSSAHSYSESFLMINRIAMYGIVYSIVSSIFLVENLVLRRARQHGCVLVIR